MNDKEARQLSLDLLSRSEMAILTTIGHDGFPNTRALFNLRNKQQFSGLSALFEESAGFVVYFTTNTSSSKIEQIKSNPKVSVYYCKPSEFRGLMLGGEIEIVADVQEKERVWQKGWEMYYPGGVHDTDHTVLRLLPTYARYYHQLSVRVFNPQEQNPLEP